jgi:hypothetical protein
VSIIDSSFEGGGISDTLATEWTILPGDVERCRLETRENEQGITSLDGKWRDQGLNDLTSEDEHILENVLKIGSMVVPLRPAFCLMGILFYLVVSYHTATELTGYETKTSVDLVCLL